MTFLKEKFDALGLPQGLNLIRPIVFCVVAMTVVGGLIVRAQNPSCTTLVVFSDKSMPSGLWPALITALRDEMASGSPDTAALTSQIDDQHPSPNPCPEIQILHGDQVQPGIALDRSITVYLHGECTIEFSPRVGLLNPPRPWLVSGALGWVRSDNGRIDPFIHVACTPIGQMLTQQALGQNLEGRNHLIAAGIARVILHEWIHIATQSAHHSRHGITQAQFGVGDLLASRPGKPRSHRHKAAQPTDPINTIREGDSQNGGR